MPTEKSFSQISSPRGRRATSHTALVLGGGFALVLALLGAVVAIGVSQLKAANERLEQVVTLHNEKQELSEQLFRYARERVVVLQRMFVLEDPFERDELSLRLDHFAANYIITRRQLIALGLTPAEKRLLDRQFVLARQAVEVQRQISVLIIDGELDQARILMADKMIPAQQQVLNILQELAELQRTASRASLAETLKQQRLTRLMIYTLGVGAALIGALIAFFSVRRTRRTELALDYEKERAQVSLHSLADGVITTTSSGRIDYLNPVAARLTGWTLEAALDHPLYEVLRLVDAESRRPLIHSFGEVGGGEERRQKLTNHSMLLRQDGQELQVEHSVAQIGFGEPEVGGVVVVFRDVSERVELARQLTHQVQHDPLTGLYNRREFEFRLQHALDSARQFDQQHMLLFLDLDRFKVVNDSCGHAAGDELLRRISALLQSLIRDSDLVARLGGDEFGILLEACPEGRALAISESIRAEVEGLNFHWQEQIFTIGVSIGATPITARSGDLADLQAQVDAACYLAKSAGRNRVHLHREGEELRLTGGGSFIDLVRGALVGTGFQLNCQRIKPLHLKHDQPPMCEVLLRLAGPNGRELLPMAFIPTAERYNLMVEVDLWVIEHLLGRLLHEPQVPDRLFAINLSEQSLASSDFLASLKQMVAQKGVSTRHLCFEIDESSALNHLPRLHELVAELHQLGARVALDDFGQSLATFVYLKELPIDYIKLDASLTRDLVGDELKREMVRSMVGLASLLGISTVAKYVEDQQTERLLDELGVNYVQGYFVDRPQPLSGPLVQPIVKGLT